MDINLETNTENKQNLEHENNLNRSSGIGIDIGTGTIITAISKNSHASFKMERDAFFEIEKNISTISMLSKMKSNYIETEDKKHMQIVGNQALELADFFNAECKRPLAHGVISTREKSALIIIKLILKQMLGDPIVKNEVCYFSVPAKPIDKDNYNVIYHENVLKSFITSFGFNAFPINEALAIVWSNLGDEDYTGLTISAGAGMCNVCLAFKGFSDNENQFSFTRAGDFIDISAAEAVGLKASRVTVIKEAGIDLLNPKSREETAIKIYYDNLIKYVCNGIEKKFNSAENIPNFKNPISVILSGGTSKPIGFDKIFEQEIMTKSLPFKIKQVKLAKDQFNAVAEGCLLNAINHE